MSKPFKMETRMNGKRIIKLKKHQSMIIFDPITRNIEFHKAVDRAGRPIPHLETWMYAFCKLAETGDQEFMELMTRKTSQIAGTEMGAFKEKVTGDKNDDGEGWQQ